MADDALTRLDDAFLRLRRVWSDSRPRITQADGSSVEMSTLLVVEACAHGAATLRPVSVSDVAVFADVTPSTASRLVQRAVTAGFVLRYRPPFRGQRSALRLTVSGAALHEISVQARLAWLREHLDGWPNGAIDDLAELLHTFADTLD